MRMLSSHTRSAAFYAAVVLVTLVMSVACLPSLLGPRSVVRWLVRLHTSIVLFLLKRVHGLDHRVIGAGALPAGPCIIASKHQSAWETIAFLAIWPDPVIFLKRELLYIPLWGWYAMKLGMVPVARSRGASTIRKMLAATRRHAAAGRQLIIFPEGSRTRPFDAPDYKSGVTALYQGLGLPCVPVALDSGCYWPRRSFLKYPGTITVQVLAPIAPGLPRAEFETRLQDAVESATAVLLERSRSLPHNACSSDKQSA